MMDCGYIYDMNGQIIQALTMPGLLAQLFLELSNPVVHVLEGKIKRTSNNLTMEDRSVPSTRWYFKDDLTFYHSTGLQVLQVMRENWTLDEAGNWVGVNKKHDLKSLKGKLVTEVLTTNRDIETVDEVQVIADDYMSFCKNIGTLLHKLVQLQTNPNGVLSDEYADTTARLKKLILAKAEFFQKNENRLYHNLSKFGYKHGEDVQFFIEKFIQFEAENDGKIERALSQFIKQFRESINVKGKHVMTEVPIYYKNGDYSLKGVIDMIVYDDDGNITIYDLKTSSHSYLCDAAKLKYRFQLEAYREMLYRLGIPDGKIQIKMVKFLYGADSQNINFSYRTIPESEMIVPTGRDHGVMIQMLANYFPRTGKLITPEDQLQREEVLQKKIDAFLSPILKRKSAKESLKRYINRAAGNNNPLMLYSETNEYGAPGVLISDWVDEGNGLYTAKDSKHNILFEHKTIDEIVEIESEAIENNLSRKTQALYSCLRSHQFTQLKSFFGTYFGEANNAILLGLESYLAPEWEIIEIPQLLARNIITLYNHVTRKYSFIITSDIPGLGDSRTKLNDQLLPPNASILYPLLTAEGLEEIKKFKEFKDIPQTETGESLIMEAMLAINDYADVLDPDNLIEIDKIQAVSMTNGTFTLGVGLEKYVTTLNLLLHLANNKPESIKDADLYTSLHTKFKNKIKISDELEVLKRTFVDRYATYKLTNSDVGLDPLSSENIAKDIERLTLFCHELKTQCKDWNNESSDTGRLYITALQLILSLKRDDVYTKLYKHTSYGLTGSELFGAGLDLLKYGESRRYSFNGLIVEGMAQGLDNSVSYASSDQEIRYFQQIFSAATSQMTYQTVKIATEINEATQKYHEALNMPAFKTVMVGNTDGIYENLYELENGKISGQMILKNPFSDKNNNLSDPQKEYLKRILWSFARFKLKSSNLSEDALEMSYDQLLENQEEHEKFELYINTRRDLRYVPLMQEDGVKSIIGNIKSLWDPTYQPGDTSDQTTGRTKKFITQMFKHMYLDIEPVLLTPQQKQYSNKDFNPEKGEFLYHSPYNVQGEHRVETLNKTSINSWVKNLNVLAIEYVASQFKEVYYNQVLQAVGNQLSTIKFMEIMTGLKLNETKEALINRVKISIFTRDCIKDEAKTMAKVLSTVKLATSIMKLAVRPALMAKEMVLGVIKNVSVVWAENFINDTPITFDNLWEAAKVVYTNGAFSENAGRLENETFGNFRLINSLNNLYRINDRDLNNLGDSLAYDHHGFLNQGMRFLYLNTTSPDWFNRMTLLVAKMMADGSWQAHRIGKDRQIEYDAGQDLRYKPFLDYLRAKNGKIEKDEPKTEDYIKAKALYLLKIQLLKKENFTGLYGGENGKWSLNLPVAYTTQEMDSFKEQVGMLYGYYSHEERTIVQKGLHWLMHTQFATFVPGEVRKYLASGNFESAVGKTVHVTDSITGEKLYYVENESGLNEIKRESEIAPEQRTQPVYEFTFSPVEGLLVSTLKTLHDIFWAHDFDRNKNPELWKRTKLFIFNTLLSLFIKALLGYLIYLGIGKDKDGAGYSSINMSVDLANRVSSELLVTEALVDPVFNMGIVGADFMKSAASSVSALTFNEDYKVLDLLHALSSLVKDMHLK